MLQSCILLDLRNHDLVSVFVLQFVLNISSTLGAEKGYCCSVWALKKPCLIKPDEYELEILVGEPKVEQPQGDLFPVDIVQENLPLIKSPRWIRS